MDKETEIYAVKVEKRGWVAWNEKHSGLYVCGVSRLLRKISTLIEDKDDVLSVYLKVKRKK